MIHKDLLTIIIFFGFLALIGKLILEKDLEQSDYEACLEATHPTTFENLDKCREWARQR